MIGITQYMFRLEGKTYQRLLEEDIERVDYRNTSIEINGDSAIVHGWFRDKGEAQDWWEDKWTSD